MSCRILTLSLVLALCLMGGQAQSEPQISIVAEGLYYPAGLALLADGSVLIAEAGGHGERSAGISLLQPDGSLGRLVSNIPSAFSREHLISAPAVAVSPDGGTIVVGLAGAQLYSLSSGEAASVPDTALAPNDLTRRQADRGNVFPLAPL